MIKENPPYTLFQNEAGKWGTKDADGKVYDEPIYKRVEKDDGDVVFFDGYTGVCDFNPEHGMDLIVWCQPWWEDAFGWADYPKEYNDLLWDNIKADRKLSDEDSRKIIAFSESHQLTGEQVRTLADAAFYCRWISLPDEEDENKYEDEWFDAQTEKLSAQRHVDCLIPLMQDDNVSDELKSTIWYANFCFIDLFLDNLR